MHDEDNVAVLARREFLKTTGAVVGFSIAEKAAAQTTDGTVAVQRGMVSGPLEDPGPLGDGRQALIPAKGP